MRHSCFGCRALNATGCYCNLGYPIKLVPKNIKGINRNIPIPEKQCPKPLTYRQYIDLRTITKIEEKK